MWLTVRDDYVGSEAFHEMEAGHRQFHRGLYQQSKLRCFVGKVARLGYLRYKLLSLTEQG